MRPLVLTMQAFGPYADKETIDFQILNNRTMFVITGKTGAGKTTIFDGISFAIYGRASGEDRVGIDLRSQFAKDDVPTEVSLRFRLKGKEYFIWRAPQQEKKKARGDGYTVVNAKAELYEIENGNEKLIAANVREVDDKIKDLMQLDVNQFRQILMIPQGEFRKLLVSDSKDKEAILQRLFHTIFYKKVEEKLKDRSTALKHQVESFQTQKQNQLKTIFAEGHEALEQLLQDDPTNEALILPLLKEQIEKMENEIKGKAEEIKNKETERNIAHENWVSAKQILEQIERKTTLEKRKQELVNDEPVILEKQKMIENARKAEKLHQQELLCHRLKRDLDEKDNQIKQAQTELERAENLLKEKENQYLLEKGKENEREQASMYYQKLQGMQEEVLAFAGWKEELEQLQQQLTQNQSEQKQLESKMTETKGQIEHLQAKKVEAEQARLQEYEIKMQIQTVDQILESSKSLIETNRQLQASQEKLNDLKTKYERAENKLKQQKQFYDQLEKQWYQGQAALLAHSLAAGDECPVCGSVHHPKKAVQMDDLPSQEDVKQARQKTDVLDKEVNQIALMLQSSTHEINTYEEKQTELKDRLGKLDINWDTEPFESYFNKKLEEKQNLNGSLVKLSQLATNVEQFTKQLTELESTLQSLTNKKETLVANERTLEKNTTEKQTIIVRLQEQIPAELQSKDQFLSAVKQAKLTYESMVQKLEALQNEFIQAQNVHVTNKEKLNTLTNVRIEVENQLNQEREKFVNLMSENGFVNYKEYETSKKSSDQVKVLENEISAYREEFRSVTDQLIQLENMLKNQEVPNLEQLEKQIAVLDAQLQEIRSAHSKIDVNYNKNVSILQAIEEINSHVKQLEDEYKVVGHLSDISRGQNSQRITFERYVLASFLNDILKLANERLIKMTSGRYQLVRKKDRSKGNVQSGLELLVFDQYTGQERHVKTLSGGEGFKASLSLALGLADVVQEHAGGVSLETMFIDEGFGTLDPESLDHAIEALMDIQSSGRLVGIISHVPELKERIDARLEVFATPEGSKTKFSIGTEAVEEVFV